MFLPVNMMLKESAGVWVHFKNRCLHYCLFGEVYLTKRGGLIDGAESGYLYDWQRQHLDSGLERKKKRSELQKKIDKVVKKNRPIKKI